VRSCVTVAMVSSARGCLTTLHCQRLGGKRNAISPSLDPLLLMCVFCDVVKRLAEETGRPSEKHFLLSMWESVVSLRVIWDH